MIVLVEGCGSGFSYHMNMECLEYKPHSSMIFLPSEVPYGSVRFLARARKRLATAIMKSSRWPCTTVLYLHVCTNNTLQYLSQEILTERTGIDYPAFCSVFAFFGRIGMKFPTINEGLFNQVSSRLHHTSNLTSTHILCVSLLIVKEKQHLIVSSSPPSFFSSFFSVQLVRIAF
jgi:hypothetical protein